MYVIKSGGDIVMFLLHTNFRRFRGYHQTTKLGIQRIFVYVCLCDIYSKDLMILRIHGNSFCHQTTKIGIHEF